MRWIAAFALILALMPVGHAAADEALLAEGEAAFNRGDNETALSIFRPLAEEGNATAQGWLGTMYLWSFGVKENFGQALKWSRLGAEQDEVYSLYQMGLMYKYGFGVKPDDTQAQPYFDRLLAKAQQDDLHAQNLVGQMYHDGDGVVRDFDEARRWYLLASEQGNPYASLNLGYMYEWGDGVPADFNDAANWFALSIEQGYVLAEHDLDRVGGVGAGYKSGKDAKQEK
ncbi:MAG: tetratricopeptide repeat protein [Pseudomonadota bacterium]